MHTKVKAAFALPIVGAIAFLLSGCDQNMFQGPAAIQRDGAELVVAICRDIEIGTVLIETSASGFGTPIETILSASGSRLISARSELTVREVASDLSVSIRAEAPLDPGDELAVQFLPAESTDQQISATFTIKEEGLSETLWLHPDGRESTDPCF